MYLTIKLVVNRHFDALTVLTKGYSRNVCIFPYRYILLGEYCKYYYSMNLT